MSREIKFRQFVPDVKAWHYWGYIDEDDTFTSPIHGKSQQFTGLLDKLGKEIYEGDLLKRYDSYGEVYYQTELARFAIDSCEGSRQIDKAILFHQISPKRLEVIGNIYEHSALLD